MKRFLPKILASLILITIVVLPHLGFAQVAYNGEYIKCGNNGQTDCGFKDLVQLVQDVINGLIKLSTLIVVGVLVYAGFKLMTSNGNEGEWTKAKGMLWKILQGYAIILVAWLVVYTIFNVLVKDSYSLLGSSN